MGLSLYIHNILLSENRVNDVIKKYGEFPVELIYYMVEEDPSGNNKYLAWAVNKFNKNPKFKSLSGYEKTNLVTDKWDIIKRFHDLQPYIIQKDINKYSDFDDLNEVVTTAFEKSLSKLKKNLDYKTLYDSENFLIVEPLTHRGSCRYGAGTKWCTTSKEYTSHFTTYTQKTDSQQQKLIYIINRNSGNDDLYYKMALHVSGIPLDKVNIGLNEIMGYAVKAYDSEDKNFNVRKLFYENYPELSKLFNLEKLSPDMKLKYGISLSEEEYNHFMENSDNKFLKFIFKLQNLDRSQFNLDDVLFDAEIFKKFYGDAFKKEIILSRYMSDIESDSVNQIGISYNEDELFFNLNDEYFYEHLLGSSEDDYYLKGALEGFNGYGWDYDDIDPEEINYITSYLTDEVKDKFIRFISDVGIDTGDEQWYDSLTNMFDDIKIIIEIIDDFQSEVLSEVSAGLSQHRQESTVEYVKENFNYRCNTNSDSNTVVIPFGTIINTIIKHDSKDFTELIHDIGRDIDLGDISQLYYDAWGVSEYYTNNINNLTEKFIEDMYENIFNNDDEEGGSGMDTLNTFKKYLDYFKFTKESGNKYINTENPDRKIIVQLDTSERKVIFLVYKNDKSRGKNYKIPLKDFGVFMKQYRLFK